MSLVLGQTLGDVGGVYPHRHMVFSIPKMFRVFFKYNRKLLTQLCRCAWRALTQYLEVEQPEGMPAAVVSIQTAGDFLNWNPRTGVHMKA